MSIPLPPFDYRSYEPYTVSFDWGDNGFRATCHDSLLDALAYWYWGAPNLGEPDEPDIRILRDARGVVIYARDLTHTTVPILATKEIIDTCMANAPNMAATMEEIEMLVREVYVLHGRAT